MVSQSHKAPDRSDQLGKAPITHLLLRFSVPATIGMVVQALYNIIDRIYIGNWVGELGIAAVTVNFPIMLLTMAFGMLIGIGGSALLAIRLGERKRQEAEIILANSFLLLCLIALSLTAIGLCFTDPLLRLFGASDRILPLARPYLRIVLFGMVSHMIAFGMNGFIRGEGNPRMAMYTMLIGAILNIVLDPICIKVLGWGIRGAAWATISAQTVSALWVLWYYFGGASSLKIRWRNCLPHPRVIRGLCAIGLAPFTMQLANSFLTALLNNQPLRYGGDLAISVVGVIFSINSMILMPVFGIRQGAGPIMGYNYGAQAYQRVKQALLWAAGAASLVTFLGFLVSMFLPKYLFRMFNAKDPEFITMGCRAIRIFSSMLAIVGFQIVCSSYFQAVGKASVAIFLSMSRQLLIFIPMLYILPRFWGLDGVWMASPVSDLMSSLLTGCWLWIEFRGLGKRYKPYLEG